jgi:oligosaccharide 4-alpha-D-glucosyltransferase
MTVNNNPLSQTTHQSPFPTQYCALINQPTTMSKQLLATPLFLLMFVCSIAAQTKPTCYVNHKASADCIIVKSNDGYVQIRHWAPGVFRISFSVDTLFANPSDGVAQLPIPGDFREFNGGIGHRIEAGKTTLRLAKEPLSITFNHPSLEQPLCISLGNDFPEQGRGFSIALTDDEQITGGGARAIALNRRNRLLRLNNEPHWGYGLGQENLNYSLPVFVSSNNYLIFYDAPQRAWADIGKAHPAKMSLYSQAKDYSCFLVLGNNYANLIEKYTELTGRQPLPPLWALGNLQSRFGYQSQAETIAMADTLINAGYPLDAIIIDLYWFGKGPKDWGMGNLEWEPENWPNPQAMTKNLNQKGVKTIIITEPFILNTSGKWAEADAQNVLGKDSAGNSFVIKDFYFGPAGLVDVFDPKASNWFWDQYIRLKKVGIDGWWGDLGEPERHPSGIRYAKGTSDELHNIYGHYWSKLLADGYAKQFPNERLFFLNRAGYAGSQRYSVFPWSGDVSRSWSGFEAQLPIMLGMAMNGIPYMHSDLGGFAAGVKDEELYRRWMQFGVFNPVFRPHGESIPSEPIFFNDTTQRIVKEAIELRYKLMPYNYTLAWEQTTKGWPLARPLAWYNQSNKALFDVYDTYYWGESFLVSPVLKPGIKEKPVYLPNGNWYNFATNELHTGDKLITAQVTANSIPVFVKAGSFVPMAPKFKSTQNYPTDTLIVRVYPSKDNGSMDYTLFTDDGHDALSLKNNQYQLIHFTGTTKTNQIDLSIKTTGQYVGMPQQRTIVWEVVMANAPQSVAIDNKKLKKSHFNYDIGSQTLTIRTTDCIKNVIIKSK